MSINSELVKITRTYQPQTMPRVDIAMKLSIQPCLLLPPKQQQLQFVSMRVSPRSFCSSALGSSASAASASAIAAPSAAATGGSERAESYSEAS
eukprot:6706-Heterococcus_DN1.PRE.1